MTEEQGQLIETGPEHSDEIIAVAKRYKAHQLGRISALAEEKAAKQKLLELVKAEGLEPVEGKIKMTIDGYEISITPRDELVQVKELE